MTGSKLPALILLVFTRWLVYLALSLWIGGMAFFGIMAAPVLFKVARAHEVPDLAPIMVGQMLGRFSFVTFVCGALLMAGWIVDGLLVYGPRIRGKWYWMQGACSFCCTVLGIYLGLVLLPGIQRAQSTVLPAFIKKEKHLTLDGEDVKLLAEFDRGHKAYQQIAVVNLWLAVGVLVCLTARSTAGLAAPAAGRGADT